MTKRRIHLSDGGLMVLLGLGWVIFNLLTTGDWDGHPGSTCHQVDNAGDYACYDDVTGEDVTGVYLTTDD